MRTRLHHPLWTHAPAFVFWAGFMVWFLANAADWSSAVPLQIGWDGQPTTWGSPWIALAIVSGLGFLFLALGVLIDELWARQESRKRFNLLSLLDEVVMGLLVTIQAAFLRLAAEGATVFRVPLDGFLLGLGGALALGIGVELLRPHRAFEVALVEEVPMEGFQMQLRQRLSGGETLVYWDIQNPRYVSWLSIGIPVVLWIAAGLIARTSLLAASVQAFVGLILLQFYGGQRTRVDRQGVSIRYGLAGLRVFRCRFDEILSIRVRTFAPLAEFGGYGIRVAGGVTGYFLSGRRGVSIELAERRDALIGSAHPERLAAVLEALTGIGVQQEVGR